MKHYLYLVAGVMAGLVAGDAVQAASPPADAGARKARTVSGRPAAEAKTGAAKADAEAADVLLNFRGAPLEMVLNHLSTAAGFTINIVDPPRGTVELWNNQPITRTEAVTLLNAALSKNGFVAVQNGRMLSIMTRERAGTAINPVITGANPAEIPITEKIVTQIMPLTHLTASQTIRDLAPILPGLRTIVANEAGNSIIVTDTQANIHHLAEIVSALDSALAGISGIKVIPLNFADAKSVVTLIKELFATDSSRSGAGGGGGGGAPGGFSSFNGRMGGGGPGGIGGFGGPGGGGFGGNGGSGSNGNSGSSRGSTAAKVVAVADERSNSVIVTAPDDMMPTVEELVSSVDQDVVDVTELKVFHLKNADPTEMAELVSNLFPDESKSSANSANSRFGSPFGGGGSGGGPGGGLAGPGGGGGGGATTAGSSKSERAKKQGRVLAVPDPRTASLVVTTSHDLMGQVESMITRLDSDSSRKQRVYVYNLENADPQQVQQILQDIFQSQSGSARNASSSRSGTQNGVLSTRATQSQSQTGSGSGGSGSGLGTGGLTGGTTGR
jgi:type II secretory pathway component GspD/PulD (secretin)